MVCILEFRLSCRLDARQHVVGLGLIYLSVRDLDVVGVGVALFVRHSIEFPLVTIQADAAAVGS